LYRCEAALENLKHFFLDCPIYLQARTTLIDNINMATTCYTLDIKFLTCGNVNLTYEQNCIIQVKQTYEVFSKVQYIKGMQILYIALITINDEYTQTEGKMKLRWIHMQLNSSYTT
jgi:hypothetical protein